MPLDPKKILLGKIEGLKIANEAFSKPSIFNSFPSLNSSNSFEFLSDFFKLLFGADKVKSEFIRFLLSELSTLKNELLQFYRKKIVEYYNCSTNTLIPDEFFSEIEFNIKKIDFFGLLKISPSDQYGKYFYQDYEVNLDKKLYEAIENENTVINWKNILDIRYSSNKFFIKLDGELQGKTINEFVNCYLGNIQLYNEITIVPDFIDAIFGTLTSLIPVSKTNIEDRLKFDVLVENILKNLEFSDDFYTFNNEKISDDAKKKINGYYQFIDCNISYTSYDLNLLSNFVDDLLNLSQISEETYQVNFDYLINQTTTNVDNVDKATYKNNLFLLFFRYLTKSITLSLFSPKKVLFMKLFGKMTKKNNTNLNLIDFFKENQNFIKDIIKNKIEDFILKYLLSIVLQELSKIIAESNKKKQQEQLKNYKLQVQSLSGLNNLF